MTEYQHFFIVGAQRSGTTYLYYVLDEHPEIEMAVPLRPEPKFFLDEVRAGQGIDGYEATCFAGKTGAWLRGEKGTSYSEHEAAACRIAGAFPGAIILFVLRNPIERAISNYWFSVNNGAETASLEQALLHEESRRAAYNRSQFSASPYAYLKRGCYIDYINLYERYFPPEQIEILIFEALTGSLGIIQKLYARLGVAPDFEPRSAYRQVNASQRQDEQRLSPRLQQYLADYFAGPNARLAERLAVDLQQWGW